MGYPTRADLVAASAVDALTGADATAQDGFYAVAKRLVERFCNQRFDLEQNLTLSLDGNGGRRVSLPRRLATLDTLSVIGSSLDAQGVALSADHDALTIGGVGGSTWAERAIQDAPLRWPTGVGQIDVTGDWGWTDAEMPPTADSPVGIAMRLDMEDQALTASHGLAASLRAAARMGAPRIEEGPLTAEVDAPEELLSAEAQSVLEPYIWQPAAVVA